MSNYRKVESDYTVADYGRSFSVDLNPFSIKCIKCGWVLKVFSNEVNIAFCDRCEVLSRFERVK